MGKVEDQAHAIRLLKAGAIITVRAKNGHCTPMFHWKPDAYNCTIGKQRIPGAIVYKLNKRRIAVPVKRGWYTEGQFQFNRNLRDERGRFRSAKASPHGR